MTIKRLIISGSPHSQGRSATLALGLQKRCHSLYPDNSVDILSLASQKISPCQACDACADTFRCIIEDDMQTVYSTIDRAHMLAIVSPVYFAGPPAQLKALLDRLQPYYWSGARKQPKRQACLFVVGEGGDPHGHEPVVTIVRSALAVAGFKLDDVVDCVGKSKSELARFASEADIMRFQGV